MVYFVLQQKFWIKIQETLHNTTLHETNFALVGSHDTRHTVVRQCRSVIPCVMGAEHCLSISGSVRPRLKWLNTLHFAVTCGSTIFDNKISLYPFSLLSRKIKFCQRNTTSADTACRLVCRRLYFPDHCKQRFNEFCYRFTLTKFKLSAFYPVARTETD